MATICGANCDDCGMKEKCKGCLETDGHPFGGNCVVAECYKAGGKEEFCVYKNRVIAEFNALGIPGMPSITELFPLCGCYVNLEYQLPNGEKVKLLKDNNIYLGNQVEKNDKGRCYGLVADDDYLLVCEYGCNGTDPQIVLYQKR